MLRNFQLEKNPNFGFEISFTDQDPNMQIISNLGDSASKTLPTVPKNVQTAKFEGIFYLVGYGAWSSVAHLKKSDPN